MNIKNKILTYGVKIVLNIYLIQQDISKVKRSRQNNNINKLTLV